MAIFRFNTGEIKDLHKPLANIFQTRGMGVIIEDSNKTVKFVFTSDYRNLKSGDSKMIDNALADVLIDDGYGYIKEPDQFDPMNVEAKLTPKLKAKDLQPVKANKTDKRIYKRSRK
jgi:hypothetical protein